MDRLDPAESRAAWRAARTFEELCHLAAGFLEGRVTSFPGWVTEDTDEETDALAPTLGAVNRAGFLTVASQPGRPEEVGHDGRVWKRRAFVGGFARRSLAERLEALAGPRESAGLRVASFAADASGGEPIPVGLRGDEPFLLAGHAAGPEEFEIFRGHVSDDALAELGEARFLWIVDLEWGRDDRLWPRLAAAVRKADGGLTTGFE